MEILVLAPLLVPPFIMMQILAGHASTHFARFPKRCVIVAMGIGYLAAFASIGLSLARFGSLDGNRFNRTIWPTLIVPVVAALLLAFAISALFRIACPRKYFTLACVFSHAHLTGYCLFGLWSASPGVFKEALSLRWIVRLFHM
ncbi:hypothetical protein [Paraburkholderia sp. J8-2]|uniref:hypothetical protein n=1 Tax=Paraburkholderia sp. J8-2 TaxID=2805440 RepID=UPI002AB7107B|nr:hypothetical protein [Paraburkholderia sp. J8-2]